MRQTHTLAILLTILFHTLEQVGVVIEFAMIGHFGVIFRFRAWFLKHAVRVCRLKLIHNREVFMTFKLPKIELLSDGARSAPQTHQRTTNINSGMNQPSRSIL